VVSAQQSYSGGPGGERGGNIAARGEGAMRIRQLVNSSAYQRANQLIITSTLQHIITPTHQHTNTPTHQHTGQRRFEARGRRVSETTGGLPGRDHLRPHAPDRHGNHSTML
jgi:hypothetical protein